MKREPSKIKSDILLRVRLLYVLFILAGAVVFLRLLWVQLFSGEVAYNAARLSNRIFTEEVIPARRGAILSRDGEPLAVSIFRYQAAFDFASDGLADTKRFREQSDSLAKLLSAYFKDRSAAEYARFFREKQSHARNNYRLTNERDTTYYRSEGLFARLVDWIRGEATVTERIYDTIRDHTLVNIFPREVDYAEWQTLRRYPLLNWNMGMVYRLVERDDRVYPQGELARRTIGDKGYIGRPDDSGKTLFGNYGIEDSYRRELSGRDGVAVRQRIARGFYGRVAGAGHEEPEDGLDVVTTLDMDLQDVADRALRSQLERQNATWGTTIVMETRTGEILALANLGRNGDGSYSERENYALGRCMEPGSTFKLASMLLLLDDAKMSPETTYDVHNGDPVKVGPATNIRDSHRGDHVIDFRQAVAASSNVYFAEAVWDRYGATGRKFDYSRFLHEQFLQVITDADSLLRALSERTVGALTAAAATLPGSVLAVATCVLALFFTSASYPELCSALERSIPQIAMQKLLRLRDGVMRSLARWLRAQATLSLITFSELLAGFLLIRQRYSLLLAFLITLLDALPVFGTGTALVPWALVTLLFGFPPRAIVLLALYLCTLITRNTLEPRLLSAQAGLPPVASLFAMYLGYCTFGIAGMVLFPFFLLLLSQIRNTRPEKA